MFKISVALICVLLVISIILPYSVAEDDKISLEDPPDEETKILADANIPIEDDLHPVNDDIPDDVKENDQKTKLTDDTVEGSGDDIKIESKFGAVKDDEPNTGNEDSKGENVILKYITENPDITTLDLSNKEFSAISATMFQDKLENLKQLDLQKNVLAAIDKNAFTSLPRLESINLSTNALTTLDTETFVGLPALLELDLSGNPLELPSGSLFLNSPTLRRLRMAGCNLKQIPENTFDGMNSLEEVDLGGNPIAEETPITAAVFAALTNLTYVNLPESSANTALIKELCEKHGLLPTVCVESCSEKSISCNLQDLETPIKINPKIAKAELTKLISETIIPGGDDEESASSISHIDLERKLFAGDSAATEKMPTNKIEDMSGEPPMKVAKAMDAADTEMIPESSKSGVSGAGVNKTVIGLLVGGLVVVIGGVLLKKNWSKITGKKDDDNRRRTGANAPRGLQQDVEQGAEMVPLKNNNDTSPKS